MLRVFSCAIRTTVLVWALLGALALGPAQGASGYVRYRAPELFTFDELLLLGKTDPLPGSLTAKLQAIQTTPFISNRAYLSGVRPHRPKVPELGRSLRIVCWNIERGIRLDDIQLLLTKPKRFRARARSNGQEVDWKQLRDEMRVLRTADVLVLNEVDWGLKRSQYRAVVAELGRALRMNWAFGAEFIEVDPISLGTEEFEEIENGADRQQLRQEIAVDRNRLKGLHGTAVLSRYPIREAWLVPFQHQGYDWFESELARVALLEKGKRELAEAVFREKISREIRRGGRTTLLVALDVPDLPKGRLTIAATHLESRSEPEDRRQQMEELLALLQDVRNPVVIAGDMNTSLSSGEPTNWKREVHRRIGSKAFWANTAVKYSTGVGLIYDVVKGAVNFFKNQQDPTAEHIPFIAPNPEEALFERLEDFRFSDGTVFDFRGDEARTVNGTDGTLANSNHRDDKGFAVTFEVDRSLGPAGKFKLDWIFVKSYLETPRNTKGPYRFAPHFARTMETVNYALEERLSDHNPISIDLPFREPQLETEKPPAEVTSLAPTQ